MSDKDKMSEELIKQLVLYAMQVIWQLWETIRKIKAGEIDPTTIDMKKIRDSVASLEPLPEGDVQT